MATCSLIVHLAPGATRDALVAATAGEPRITVGPAHAGKVAVVLQTDSPQDDETVSAWLGEQLPVGWIDWVQILYDEAPELTSADFARRRRVRSPAFVADHDASAV